MVERAFEKRDNLTEKCYNQVVEVDCLKLVNVQQVINLWDSCSIRQKLFTPLLNRIYKLTRDFI